MKINSLNAISPIDGRYRKKTESLSKYFSEESLIKYRLKIEIEYFIALCKIPLPELENFNSNIDNNRLKVDFNLRTGKNHGCSFRIRKSHLAELFDNSQQLIRDHEIVG